MKKKIILQKSLTRIAKNKMLSGGTNCKKTRPKGSWGQDTDQAGTFWDILNHENQPGTLKNYKN